MRRPLFLVALLLAAGGPAQAEPLKWEPQLREMGYLFLHLSNINVINGLNLTREQALQLREMARHVEAVAPRPPTFRARLAPELEDVRRTWLEARDLLLQGKPVPEELEQRVNLARATESRIIRTTIRPRPVALTPRCGSCHRPPQEEAAPPMAVTPSLKPLVARGHAEGVYGTAGLVKMALLSPRVKAILTEGQEAILSSFSCCLVPPQDLSEPTRAGQAEGGAKALELLRKIRQCPERWWPLMRGGILAGADRITRVVSPGASAARTARARAEIAQLLDRVRSLGEVEFEMEKDALAKAVKDTLVPAQGDSPYKAAFFLLLPGSSGVYTRLLERLAEGESGGPR